jgi:transcription elongation GreA/GreB family factor
VMVGPTEGNMARGLLSIASPLGRALVDRRAGDTITFQTPDGERKATLVSVS